MTPSPTDLAYFIEIASTQNLSRAAEQLGISQPSLTLAIRRLEKTIGTTILIRHKRGVTLSNAGKQLLANARQLLDYWEKIKTETLASTEEVRGTFTIGCHPSLAIHTLPRFLGNLLEKNPKLEIKLEHNISRKITEQVINLTIDIGIVVNPIKHPDLIIKHLEYSKIGLWRSKEERKIQDLRGDQAVLFCDPDLPQIQSLLKKIKKEGLHFTRLIPSNNFELIANLVSQGSGIGILPESIAHTYHLVPVPKTPHYQDEICLLYRGENRHVKSIQVITEAIKAAFKTRK